MGKFMPRFKSKYKKVTAAFLEALIYTMDMPNSALSYVTFHTLELRPFKENDATLFPLMELACLGPVITVVGKEEWQVKGIIEKQKWGWGMQYLVTFTGYGPNHNWWIPR